MNELQIFNNEEFGEIRTVTIDNEPWFVGKDVAAALGYKDTADAIKVHVDEEDKKHVKVGEIPTLKTSNYGATLVNESGVYALVFGSKLESAKRFKHWVTSEVLPSIRKHGAYMTPETIQKAIMNPDFLINLAQELKNEQEKNEALTHDVNRMKPKEIFADAVSTSDTSILIGELAKLIKQNGKDIGQNRLFAWLRENGYLISRKGTDYNMPTQKAMDLGLFEVKERTISNPDGTVKITKTPKVTGKGQLYFINKFVA